jgi:hypothetical protein
MYTIHPSDDVKQLNGSAVTATSTNLAGGAAHRVANSNKLLNIAHGYTSTIHGAQVIRNQRKGATSPLVETGVAATSVADEGGFCKFTKNSHGLSVGDVLNISGATARSLNTVHVITAEDTNTFTTDVPYVASATAGTYKKVRGTFGMEAGSYVIRGVSEELAGIANTTLRSGASDFGIRRAIHKREAVRTVRTTTAIRAGYWNNITGQWTTRPTIANDISDLGTDEAATPSYVEPGKLTYNGSGKIPVSESY